MSTDPPPASDIVCDRHDSGRVVFYVPAMGINNAGGKSRGCFGLGGWLLMSVACAGFALLLTISGLFEWRDAMARPWNAGLFCFFLWSAPTFFLLVAWHLGERRTVLEVIPGKLTIDTDGPLGSKHREFGLADLNDIRQDWQQYDEGPDPRIPNLIVETQKARRYVYFAGRREDELMWLTASLREALALPPPPKLGFLGWLKRYG
jgi:hypothetical protein